MQNEDGPTIGGQREEKRAIDMLERGARGFAVARGLRLGEQASPPDPIENEAQAWRFYAALLENMVYCRDAFRRANLDFPPALEGGLQALLKTEGKT